MFKRTKLVVLCLVVVLLASMAVVPVQADNRGVITTFPWGGTNDQPSWDAFVKWASQFYPGFKDFTSVPIVVSADKLEASPTTGMQWDDAAFAPVQKWAEMGLIRPLDNLIKNYPNLMAIFKKDPYAKQLASYQGKLYAINISSPLGNANDSQTGEMVWRGDLLKEAGFSTPPTTIADIEKFCKAVKDKHPDIYPLGMDLHYLVAAIGNPVFGIKTVVPENNWQWSLVRTKAGKVLPWWMTEAAKPITDYVSNFIKKGWIDPEYTTALTRFGGNNETGIVAAWMTGKYGATLAATAAWQCWKMSLDQKPEWKATWSVFQWKGPKGPRPYWNASNHGFNVVFAADPMGNLEAEKKLLAFADWAAAKKNAPAALAFCNGPRFEQTIDFKNGKTLVSKDLNATAKDNWQFQGFLCLMSFDSFNHTYYAAPGTDAITAARPDMIRQSSNAKGLQAWIGVGIGEKLMMPTDAAEKFTGALDYWNNINKLLQVANGVKSFSDYMADVKKYAQPDALITAIKAASKDANGLTDTEWKKLVAKLPVVAK